MNEKLRVAQEAFEPEIFHTLQGEGRNIGNPATFVRLSGCNLQCQWCDTPYTWNWDGTDFVHEDDIKYDRAEQQMTLDIGSAVDRITGEQCERVVITGGEPLTQQTGVIGLISRVKEQDPNYKFEIETNGTIVPKPELIEVVDRFNVSPKLSNAGMTPEKRIKPEALATFASIPNADFKFVVDTPQDLAEVQELISLFNISPSRIYLMPQGRTVDEQKGKELWVAELCKDNGFNFTPRLHIELWGSKRGV